MLHYLIEGNMTLKRRQARGQAAGKESVNKCHFCAGIIDGPKRRQAKAVCRVQRVCGGMSESKPANLAHSRVVWHGIALPKLLSSRGWPLKPAWRSCGGRCGAHSGTVARAAAVAVQRRLISASGCIAA